MSEPRYIDANALDSALLKEDLSSALIGYPNRRTLTVGEIRWILQKAPTVPAEVVVHCRDCNHYQEDNINWCTLDGTDRNPTDYCSYGERRESEEGK